MDTSKFFNLDDCYYFGHGTGDFDSSKGPTTATKGIFENGLRCSKGLPGIYFTTIALGEGSDKLFEENRKLLDNWPHKDSKKIVIVCIPKTYYLSPCHLAGNAAGVECGTAAYCYAYKQPNGDSNYYLMPEFVRGFYDANNHTFEPNDKFFLNTNKKGREEIFSKVKQNYTDFLKDQMSGGMHSCKSFAELKSLLQEFDMNLPLSDEEIANLDEQLSHSDNTQETLSEDKTHIDELPSENVNDEEKVADGWDDSDENWM